MAKAQAPSESWSGKDFFLAALIPAVTLLAYIPALRAGFIWDDDHYVTNNTTLMSLEGLRRIWFELGATVQYYPMVFTTFWLEQHLWGLAPAGYHLVNVLIHACSAILLGRILYRLAVPGAWLAAAIFALHPVHVETVAWITERKNTLSCLFYLLALLSFLRFDDLSPTPRWRLRYYVFALAFFVFALFSKTITCSLPAAILLLIGWKRGRLTRRDLLHVLPMFAIGVALAAVTVWMEKHNVGASGDEWTLSPIQRFLLAGRAICFYAYKLIWPLTLAFIYPRWEIDTGDAVAWLWPALVIATIIAVGSLRRQIGRGPLTAILFFCGTLVPALGFINVYPFRYSFVADHFQYLASMGLIALLAALLARMATLIRPGPPRIVAAASLALLLAVRTNGQSRIYTDAKTLWHETVAANPRAWIAHNNLAIQYVAADQPEKALEHFHRAIQSNPACVEARNSLAGLLLRLGRIDESIAEYRAALPYSARSPSTHYNLSAALGRLGRTEEQLALLREALKMHPGYYEARRALAIALADLKRLDEAIPEFQEVLRVRPMDGDARTRLAAALAEVNRLDEAAAEYETCLHRWPRIARLHYELAAIYQKQGKPDLARRHLDQAAQLDPAYSRKPSTPP